MAAWHYAFLFPGRKLRFDSANAVASLASNGFEVSNTARRLVPFDETGHYGEFGEEISLEEPFTNDLQQRLRDGEQLFVEITRNDIAHNDTDTIAMTIACSFALKTSNPNISFGWHERLFSRLPPETQHFYWQAIRDAARAANAAYVVLVDEAADDFEDRFIDIDGRRILDTQPSHQWGHGIRAVWVDSSTGTECPVGVAASDTADIGNGYVQYSVH